ncbi:MAG: hypothetical protein KF893_10310, partial [Caldilineaceae bacterium]|nr:hypothetical protein [Caldilineaceae bacterium]
MPISFAQTAGFTCPGCRRPFEAEIWLIVDTAERPDLLDRLAAGTLHDLPCPACGHAGTVDAPILVFHTQGNTQHDADAPGSLDPPSVPSLRTLRGGLGRGLLFSPAGRTSPEEDRQHAGGLLGLLAERLGERWDDAWLQTVQTVPRPLLPAALADNPNAALAQMQAEMAAALEQMRQEDPETFAQLEAAARRLAEESQKDDEDDEESGEELPPLLWLLNDFVSADSWDESQRIVEAHPDLLTDEAVEMLDQLAAAARAQGDAGHEQLFGEHRDLLRRCQQAGVARAFAEKTLPAEALAQAEALGITPEE